MKDKKNKELSAVKLEQNYFRKAFNNAVICILIVLACFAVMSFLVNKKNGICRYELNLFGFSKTMPVIVEDSFSSESGGIEFAVDSCSIDCENNMLYMNIRGRNLTDEVWCADGRTFAVAVQRVKDSFSREYYYNVSGDWESAEAESGNAFFFRLGFQIDNVKESFENGDIFSLVAFRGADHPTSVIVLNEMLTE
ncbi:MAG: hypothetical protein ACI4I1_06370 [Oscillospiraceae bacterium]